jgi:hypothetical protein
MLNRFHVDSGPASLFERVRFKIRGARDLVLTHEHFENRQTERSFPSELVLPFDPEEWELLTAEVFNSGKFGKTTWARVYSGKRWFITFAKGDIAVTAYAGSPRSRGNGPIIVTSGPFFNKVEQVNRELMESETSSL